MAYVFCILYIVLAGTAFVAQVRQAQYANTEPQTGVTVQGARTWAGIKIVAIGLFLICVSIDIQVRGHS